MLQIYKRLNKTKYVGFQYSKILNGFNTLKLYIKCKEFHVT